MLLLAVATARVKESPLRAVPSSVLLSLYQVTRSPALTETESQGRVLSAAVKFGKTSARPHF